MMKDVMAVPRILALALLLFASGCASIRTVAVPFDSTARLALSDRTAFSLAEADGQDVLVCLGKSSYSPPFRSPLAIALVRAPSARDFEMRVEARSTTADYPHRDLVFVFGYQSPQRFYYVHLAPSPDPRAHGIFKVFDAERVRLDPVAASGLDWGERWHEIVIRRSVESGSIDVAVDGTTLLHAIDSALEFGLIGVGSFDDAGEFRALELSGELSFDVDAIPLFDTVTSETLGAQP